MKKLTYIVEMPEGIDPVEGLALAREKASGVGIVIEGDEERGSFSGMAKGTYAREESKLRFEVHKKPFLVTQGMIEKGLERVFGKVTVVS